MKTSAIRKKLITYLADADGKKIKALYTLLEQEIDKTGRIQLTKYQVNLLDERKSNLEGAIENSSTWQEVHNRIQSKKKPSSTSPYTYH